MDSQFGIKACMESVEFDVEFLHKDPIRMLGEYTLRAKQDVFFNKTMIEALNQYIESHNIKWNQE